jgi:uncharacterized protein (TIGR03435 family)
MSPTTKRAEARPMLQSLLRDRFDLHFHMESKVVIVYALIAEAGRF